MHHFSDNWPGPDDGHLHYNIIKTFWPQTREAGHLRAAFDLKHADCVGFLQGLINGRIICREPREIDILAIVRADDLDGFFEHRHHPKAEQIHFDDAHIGAIFFIPLHHHAAGHGRGLDGTTESSCPAQITMPPECWPRWRGRS